MAGTVPAVEGRPLPTATDASRPFWEATRHRRLEIQWCEQCAAAVHFPRSFCPRQPGHRLSWREASGRGEVYSFTVDHRPAPPFGPEPLVVALVELEEGPRLMTNITGGAPGEVSVGMAVEVVWEPLPDGRHLPLFWPAPT